MGAYPKPNVRHEEPQLAEIIEIGSRQAVRLPDGFHFEGHEVQVSHTSERGTANANRNGIAEGLRLESLGSKTASLPRRTRGFHA